MPLNSLAEQTLPAEINYRQNTDDFEYTMADIVTGWSKLTDVQSTEDNLADQIELAEKVLEAIDQHVEHFRKYNISPGIAARTAQSISYLLTRSDNFDREKAFHLGESNPRPIGIDVSAEYKAILRDIWQSRTQQISPPVNPDAYERMIFDIVDMETLCHDDEHVVWSCQHEGRYASICGSADKSFLQLRMGTLGSIEVALPEAGTHPVGAFRTELFVANYSVYVEVGDVKYEINEEVRSNFDSVIRIQGEHIESFDCASTHDDIETLNEFGLR